MAERLQKIFAGHSAERSSLIPLLQDVQEEFGYLTAEAMTEAAGFLGIPESTIYGVATFYAQFYFQKQGRHKIRICQGTACHVRGSKQVMCAVQEKLGIGSEETTPDYQFTLERVACVGSCALAPVVVLDGRVHGAVTPAKAETLIEEVLDEPPADSEGEGEETHK